jgi:serine/threonine-protein kinase
VKAIATGVRLDRYQLVKPVADGGQGSVWKAFDTMTGAAVALKIVSEGVSATKAVEVERFRREAASLMQIQHPSIVHCHAKLEDREYGVMALVLEWVEGQTLNGAAVEPLMGPAHRMHLLGHLVRAIAHLHQAGIVHRDLKFGNVLVSHEFWANPSSPGTIKLVDLGVAAAVGNPRPLTQLGGVVGTAAYVAPELVLKGDDPRLAATYAGDVFAFGILGWRLLTGEHPTGLSLKASFFEFLEAYRDATEPGQPWPVKGSVDGPWGELLRRCLLIKPAERPANAVELASYLDGRPVARPALAPSAPDDAPTMMMPSVQDMGPVSVRGHGPPPASSQMGTTASPIWQNRPPPTTPPPSSGHRPAAPISTPPPSVAPWSQAAPGPAPGAAPPVSGSPPSVAPWQQTGAVAPYQPSPSYQGAPYQPSPSYQGAPYQPAPSQQGEAPAALAPAAGAAHRTLIIVCVLAGVVIVVGIVALLLFSGGRTGS